MSSSADAAPVRPRLLGVRTDLAVLVAQGSEAVERDDYLVLRTPANPSYHWGNCLILDASPRRGSLASWLDAFAREHPAAAHVAIGIDADARGLDPDEATTLGLAIEHDTVLTAESLGDPGPEIDGVSCRLVDPRDDDTWAGLVDLELVSFGDDPGHGDFVTRRFAGIRPLVADGRAAWCAAYADGRVVASLGVVALAGGLARYQHVVTHPDLRRRGIAGRLLRLAGEHATTVFGTQRLVIVADPDGPAIELYRAAGFTDYCEQWALYRAPGRPVAV